MLHNTDDYIPEHRAEYEILEEISAQLHNIRMNVSAISWILPILGIIALVHFW
ncbi:MAG: hypothetical protein WDN10_02055 [bacterium]